MSEEIAKRHDSIIEDEVLRSRIRGLVSKPESPGRPGLTRLSSNPLVALLVGFILTGVVGTRLTSYYSELQRQADAKRQAGEKVLDDGRNKQAKELEFNRQQNLLEIQHRQLANDKLLDAQRAKETKTLEAARTARERDLEYARSQVNVVEDRKIEQAKLLEIFVKYVSSKDPSEREFGYEMFVTFGQGNLAARIIARKADPAGRSTLIDLQNSTSASGPTKQIVSAGLVKISDVQLKRILSVVSIFETGNADGNVMNNALSYLPDPTNLFEIYLTNTDGKFREQLRPYVERMRNKEHVSNDQGYRAMLQQLESDQVMTTILENYFKQHYLNPALEIADGLGVKTVLGLAIIVDTSVHSGIASTKRFSDSASQTLNGSPKGGVDEKTWLRKFLELRMAALNRLRVNDAIKKFWTERSNFFIDALDKNNMDLLPPFEFRGRTFA